MVMDQVMNNDLEDLEPFKDAFTRDVKQVTEKY